MNRVMNLLLVPPVHQAVQTRYRNYRRHGSSAFTAFFTTLLVALGWIFLRFESPGWQRLRAARSYWFPIYPPAVRGRRTRCAIWCKGCGCWCSAPIVHL